MINREQKGPVARAWVALAFGITCVGASAIFVRLANVHGLVSATYRIVTALICVFPFFLHKGRRPLKARAALVSVAAGLCFGFELACWNVAVMRSSATLPTLLVNLSSVWVGIGAFMFLRERTSAFHWIGNAVALLGVAAIIGSARLIGMRIGQGAALSVAASLFLAAYTLLVRKARAKSDTVSVLFFALIGSAVPLLAMCGAMGLPLGGYSGNTLFYMLLSGIVTQVGGYFSVNYALGHIPSTKVSLATLFQPVLTAIFAALFLRETIHANIIVGGCVILSGIALSFSAERMVATKGDNR